MKETQRLFVAAALLVLLAALQVSGAAPVRPDHPRLLLRADSEGNPRLVTLEMVRNKARDPRYNRFRDRLKRSIPNLAMRALAYGDDAAADSAIALMVKPIEYSNTTWDGYRVMFYSLGFDWLYNHPNFDDWEKALTLDRIVAGARYLHRALHEGSHLFHTRMYGWTTGLAAAGYALSGHFGEAGIWLEYANQYYRNDLLPGRRLLGGSVHNGSGYGRHYIMAFTGHYLSLVYTATGEDLWMDIRRNQDDWAAREALFIIYGRQPDGLMFKFGDCYRRTSERFSFRAIAERNWHYREPVLQGYLNFLLDEQAGSVFEMEQDYMAYLYYEPELQSATVEELPARAIFGQHGTGMVFWRGGWERSDPWIFFKSGDYFGNHGHYDQGNIEIFRDEPLLTEAGAYVGGFSGSNFRMDFYRKAISHNTLLVVDPQDPSDEGGQRVYMNQTLGTMPEYLADLGAETGDIVAYRESPQVSYLKADLTAAYPRDRVQRLTRELAWVADRFLVVRDKVTLAGEGFLPKVLWHCPVHPKVEKDGFTVERGGSRVVFRLLNPGGNKIKWVEGYLVGEKLWEIPRVPDYSDPCVGRIEVVGSTSPAGQEFIQVLDIAAVGTKSGPTGLKRVPEGLEIRLPDGKRLILAEEGARVK
jgi:heparinase II/III-like protein